MIPFRFIHAADLHLDSRFSGMPGVSDRIRQQLRESTFAALDHLVQLAVDQHVDFIVISGDVYDAADSSLQAQLRFQEALERLGSAGIHVYVIHGNHDPLDSPRIRTKEQEHVHVFESKMGSYIANRRSDGQAVAVISGISYPTAKVTENTSAYFVRDKEESLFHIALLHANVNGDPAHETYSPCTTKDLVASGYQYWALGHIHKRQTLYESPFIVYPGNIQGRSIKETGPKGCYIVDVDAAHNVELTFHSLEEVRWFREQVSIDDINDEEDFNLKLNEIMDNILKMRPEQMSLVRFEIIGRGSLHRILENGHFTDELLDELRRRAIRDADSGHCEGLVWVEGISVQSGSELDRGAMLLEDSFLGEMLRLAERAELEADIGEDIIQKALAPLMSNKELRKLLDEIAPQEQIDWLHRSSELAALLMLDPDSVGGMKA